MRKLLFILLPLCALWSIPAQAQNPMCPTRPTGDSTNACASTAFTQGAVINSPFQQADTHAVQRTMLAKVQETVSVTDWIPVGTNTTTTDVSTYFQNAATDMCARSPAGGTIIIPPGTYKLSTANILNTCGNIWRGSGAGGVGSANQAGIPTAGNTQINMAGCAAGYFMAWIPVGFPAFASGAHINGGGIEHMTINDGTSTCTALISEGTQDWEAQYLVANGLYNGIFMKGDEFPVTAHISMYRTRNRNYEIVGDLSGQTVSGSACSTASGDCSTRNDAWYGEYLNNIDNTLTNTVFTITGFVATTTIQHTTGEGPARGIFMTCPAGLDPNMSQCPSFGRFEDLQFENVHLTGVSLSDSLNNYFNHLYSVGDATSTSVNAIIITTANYGGSASPPGRTQITNSILFAVWGDCVVVSGAVWDVRFINNEINGCNTGNISANGINITSTGKHFLVANNQIGNVDNYGGAFTLARGVAIGNNPIWVDVHDNNFEGLNTAVSPVSSTSSSPGTIHVHDNQGPGVTGPALSACGGSPVFANIAKDDEFVVTVGSGSPTSCTVTFSNPMWATPACSLTPAPGASAAALSISTSATSTTFNGSALSGSYSLICRAP